MSGKEARSYGTGQPCVEAGLAAKHDCHQHPIPGTALSVPQHGVSKEVTATSSGAVSTAGSRAGDWETCTAGPCAGSVSDQIASGAGKEWLEFQ